MGQRFFFRTQLGSDHVHTCAKSASVYQHTAFLAQGQLRYYSVRGGGTRSQLLRVGSQIWSDRMAPAVLNEHI